MLIVDSLTCPHHEALRNEHESLEVTQFKNNSIVTLEVELKPFC